MKVYGIKLIGKQFAYDDCHKIYVIEGEEDLNEALDYNYAILPIETIAETYNNSCELKFICNWKLDKTYVAQFEDAIFEED